MKRSAFLTGVIVTIATALIGFLWIQQKRRNLVSRRALVVTLDTISQGILMIDRRGAVPVINPLAMAFFAQPEESPEATVKLAALRAADLAAIHVEAAGMPPAGLANGRAG